MTSTPKRKPRSKKEAIKSPLSFRVKRLRLNLKKVARITREPYRTIQNWNLGINRCPRSVLRLLAYYRLKHWGQF